MPRLPRSLLIVCACLLLAGVAAGVTWWLTADPAAVGVVAGLVAAATLIPLVVAALISAFRRRRAAGGLGKSLARDLGQKFVDGLKRFGQTGMGLYDRPWYLLVGEAGAGKTEAIRHANICPAGLNDPRQGAGGTTNMDWWFARGAVLLDTAGRLMFEDTPEWRQFLRLLKKHRPGQPVNGVVLAIPATSLQSDPADAIARKADQIARQLDVVQRELGVRFPVYVLVTKADLIPGWREYFASMTDPTAQNQMVGWSNPDGLDVPFRPDGIGRHLTELQRTLRRHRLEVLRDPPTLDPSRGRRIDRVDALYGLPDNLGKIASRLTLYLETVFMPNEWTDRPLFLRGVYFTQAMAEGGVLDTDLAEAFGLEPREVPEAMHVWARDRTFFLKDLFLQKVFPESGLVTGAGDVGRDIRRRRMIVGATGLAAAAAVAGGTALAYAQLREGVGRRLGFWQEVERRQAEGRPLDLAASDELVDLHRRNLDALEAGGSATPVVFRPAAALVGDVTADARAAHERFALRHAVAPLVGRAAARLEAGEGDGLIAPLVLTAAAADVTTVADAPPPMLAEVAALAGAGEDVTNVMARVAGATGEDWPADVAAPGTPARAEIDAAVAAWTDRRRAEAEAALNEVEQHAGRVARVAGAVLEAQRQEAAFLEWTAGSGWDPAGKIAATGVAAEGVDPADPAAAATGPLADAEAVAARLEEVASLARPRPLVELGDDAETSAATLTGVAATAADDLRQKIERARGRLDAAVRRWNAEAANDQLAVGERDLRAERYAIYVDVARSLSGEPAGVTVASLQEARRRVESLGDLAQSVEALRQSVRGAARSPDLRQVVDAALDDLAAQRLGRERDETWSAVAGVLPTDTADFARLAPAVELAATPLAGTAVTAPDAAATAEASAAVRAIAERFDDAGPSEPATRRRLADTLAEATTARGRFVRDAVASWSQTPEPRPTTWRALSAAAAADPDAMATLAQSTARRAEALRTLAPELADDEERSTAARRAETLAAESSRLAELAPSLDAALSAWAGLPADPLAARRDVLSRPGEFDLTDGLPERGPARDLLSTAQDSARRSLQADAAAAFDAAVARLEARLGFPLVADTTRVMTDAELRDFADSLERLQVADADPVGPLRPGGDRVRPGDPRLERLRESAGVPAKLAGRRLDVRVDRYVPEGQTARWRQYRLVKSDADGRPAGVVADYIGTSRDRPLADVSLADDRVGVVLTYGGPETTIPLGRESLPRFSLLSALYDKSLWPGDGPPTTDGRTWRLWLPVPGDESAKLQVSLSVDGDTPLPLPEEFAAK